MRITGSDFMAWYDAWAADPASKGIVWDSDTSMHDENGRWILDPEAIYKVDELGEMCAGDGLGRFIDPEPQIRKWFEDRGMSRTRATIEIAELESIETVLKAIGADIVRTVAPHGKVTGGDFSDWFRNGFPEGVFWASGKTEAFDDDGSLLLDPDAVYDLHALGEFECDASVQAPDLQKHLSDYLAKRTAMEVTVLHPDTVSSEEVTQVVARHATATNENTRTIS